MLINKIKLGDISDGYINIPLNSDFSIETRQYDLLEKNFNLSNEDIINKTVDYEKVKLYPTGDTGICDSLNFKLHFYNNSDWDYDTTKISDIGFTLDDVENKRKRLEKTFIRLSFYDSKDLKKQNLLYYSTIFIDIDDMYSKFIEDGSIITNLKTEFFVPNPKLSSKIKSFEGFNLYLFKDDIPKNDVKTIYMRVDFNNASNGRSVLFTKDKPLTISGYTMEELYNNLFYEIDCSYDSNIKKHIYKFIGKDITPYNNQEDKYIKNAINIDLYQAKVK